MMEGVVKLEIKDEPDDEPESLDECDSDENEIDFFFWA